MGSSFSVVNDTNKPIWVSDGVCHAALWGSIGGVLALLTAGTAVPGFLALSATGSIAVRSVSGLLSYSVGTAKGLSAEEEQKVLSAQRELREKLKDFKRIDPGCKHNVTGTLSLVWTAYVIYDDGRQAQRDCWTGPTAGSENLYPVTEYF